MYNRVLSGFNSERRSSAQLIASYQDRIALSKQEALARSYEPVLNVQAFNQEVVDLFRSFKEQAGSRGSASRRTPQLWQVLDDAQYGLVNAGDANTGLSYVPLWYDWKELIHQAGIQVVLKAPKDVVQVPFHDALKCFVEVKRILLLQPNALTRLDIGISLEESTVLTKVVLTVDDVDPLEKEVSSVDNDPSFEFIRSSRTTLVIKFRLSNIGT